MPENVQKILPLIILILVISISKQCLCQFEYSEKALPEDLIPWEPDDLKLNADSSPFLYQPGKLLQHASILLIKYYQKDISVQSIQRCPFYPSCSNFALIAIENHGFFIGLCMFVNRNMFRENPQIGQLYNYVQISDGVLKFDDRFFLTGKMD